MIEFVLAIFLTTTSAEDYYQEKPTDVTYKLIDKKEIKQQRKIFFAIYPKNTLFASSLISTLLQGYILLKHHDTIKTPELKKKYQSPPLIQKKHIEKISL